MNLRSTRGQTIVEFAVIAVLTISLLLGVVDMSRAMLVSTSMANAAAAGARYAAVHGSTRTGVGVNGPSGPGGNPAQVVAVVKNFAGTGLLTLSRLVITVTYPGASNAPGQLVDVTVVYPYDPLSTYFPIHMRLGSTSEAVVSF